MASSSLWQSFQQYFLFYRDLDLSLDISRLKFPEDFFEKKQVSEKLVVGEGKSAEEIARSIDAHPEEAFHLLLHLASNDQHIRVAPG